MTVPAMRTLLFGLLVTASACSSETRKLPVEVVNLSDNTVQSVVVEAGRDTLAVVAGLGPGKRRRRVATLRTVAQNDGVYGFAVKRADGIDRSFSTLYFSGGPFADSLRVTVHNDSVVIAHHILGEREDWVEDLRDMFSRFGAG